MTNLINIIFNFQYFEANCNINFFQLYNFLAI